VGGISPDLKQQALVNPRILSLSVASLEVCPKVMGLEVGYLPELLKASGYGACCRHRLFCMKAIGNDRGVDIFRSDCENLRVTVAN